MSDGNYGLDFFLCCSGHTNGLFDHVQRIFAASHEDMSSFRHFNATLVPLEDCEADTVLELSNLLAQSRLANGQSFSGPRKV
jgi:hypothetical protein